jgi:DNA repair ATPase RecN
MFHTLKVQSRQRTHQLISLTHVPHHVALAWQQTKPHRHVSDDFTRLLHLEKLTEKERKRERRFALAIRESGQN